MCALISLQLTFFCCWKMFMLFSYISTSFLAYKMWHSRMMDDRVARFSSIRHKILFRSMCDTNNENISFDSCSNLYAHHFNPKYGNNPFRSLKIFVGFYKIHANTHTHIDHRSWREFNASLLTAWGAINHNIATHEEKHILFAYVKSSKERRWVLLAIYYA